MLHCALTFCIRIKSSATITRAAAAGSAAEAAGGDAADAAAAAAEAAGGDAADAAAEGDWKPGKRSFARGAE